MNYNNYYPNFNQLDKQIINNPYLLNMNDYQKQNETKILLLTITKLFQHNIQNNELLKTIIKQNQIKLKQNDTILKELNIFKQLNRNLINLNETSANFAEFTAEIYQHRSEMDYLTSVIMNNENDIEKKFIKLLQTNQKSIDNDPNNNNIKQQPNKTLSENKNINKMNKHKKQTSNTSQQTQPPPNKQTKGAQINEIELIPTKIHNKIESYQSPLIVNGISVDSESKQVSKPPQLSFEENINNNLITPMKSKAMNVSQQKNIQNISDINESTNKTNNSTAKIKVKSPSADLAVSELNENISTQIISANPRLLNISQTKKQSNNNNNKRKKKKIKNNNNNKRKNKKKKQQNKFITSMTLPYKPNKQKQQNKRISSDIINPIRKDIDTKTRYGIYYNSKCLEKQIQDIMPYEEYKNDEQQAYDELNQPINYAVYNR